MKKIVLLALGLLATCPLLALTKITIVNDTEDPIFVSTRPMTEGSCARHNGVILPCPTKSSNRRRDEERAQQEKAKGVSVTTFKNDWTMNGCDGYADITYPDSREDNGIYVHATANKIVVKSETNSRGKKTYYYKYTHDADSFRDDEFCQ